MKAFVTLCLALLVPLSLSGKPRHSKIRRPASIDKATALKTILDAEANRDLKGKTILGLAKNENIAVAKAAILALGRIGSPVAVETLAELMNSRNKELRVSAAFALSLIGGEAAMKLLGQHTEMHKEPDVTAVILTSLGRAGNQTSVMPLARFIFSSKDATILAGAAEGLALLWSQDSAKWPVPDRLLQGLLTLAQGKDASAIPAAYALARFKGDWKPVTPAELGEAVSKTSLPDAKAFLLRGLGKLKAPATVTLLAAELVSLSNSDEIRIEAAKGLGNQDFSEAVGKALADAVGSRSPDVAVTALDTIASFDLGATSIFGAVDAAFQKTGSAWVKSAALKSLARIQPVLGKKYAAEIWANPKESVQMKAAAAYAFARIGGTAELDQLADWLDAADARIVVEALDGLTAHNEEKITPTLRVTLKKLVERADVGVTSQIASLVEQFRWTDFAPGLSTTYRFFTFSEVEPKVAILNALSTAGDSAQLDVIQLGLKDKERTVVIAAVKAMKAITGKDESAQIPLNSIYSQPVPPEGQLKAATSARVTFKTNRGDIQIKMLSAAPLTASTIVKLVLEDFYTDKTIHRVVPNFVIQGGDPRGDGYGGPGFLIRDEVSSIKHLRGTVGIATAGKDTGGCQFFINLGPNLHLNGKYTVFAEVVRGMDVVEKLEIGDKILSAKVSQ